MDATTNRTRNIAMLVEQSGGPTAFGKLVDRDQVQVSQWTSDAKPKPIGGRLARYLEEKLGHERGWLDQPQWEGGTAPVKQSQPVRFDADMVAETVEALRRYDKRQGKVYDIVAEPERFLLWYGLRQNLPETAAPDNLIRIGSVTERVASSQGMLLDERGEGVPAAGADKQNATRKRR
jgi:hypothetical protein